MESDIDLQGNSSPEKCPTLSKIKPDQLKKYAVYGNNNPRAVIDAMNRRGDYVQVFKVLL